MIAASFAGGPAVPSQARPLCGVKSHSHQPTCAQSPARPCAGRTFFTASRRATYSQHLQSRRAGGHADVLAPPDPQEALCHRSVSALNQGTAHTLPTVLDSHGPKSVFQVVVPACHWNHQAEKLKTVTFVYSLVQCTASAKYTPGSVLRSHADLSALGRPRAWLLMQFFPGKWISVSY